MKGRKNTKMASRPVFSENNVASNRLLLDPGNTTVVLLQYVNH